MKINIQFKQTDPDAKQDSSPSVTDKQPWSDISVLKQDDFNPNLLPNVMTLEHNQAILDGTMNEFPENPYLYDWGYWSLSQSNVEGNFNEPPTIDILFGNPHKGLGITLFFHPLSDDYASTVRVTWFAANHTTIIKTGVYTLEGVVGVVQEPVDGYARIKIEFLSTNIRNRFVKIYNIEYGIIQTFEDGDIDTANLLEEVDPISDILSIDTFGFSIKTHDMLFSPISGNAADNMFMKRQSMTVTGDGKPFGTFFLDTWKDKYNNGTVFDFQAMGAIGAMEGYRFMGDIYVNTLASDIISQLFVLCFPTGLIRYQLDDVFIDMRVSGHIPICTARQALQYVCFAIGAVADTSRRNYIWIYKRDTEKTFDIPSSKIYMGGSNEPTQYFSGIDLTAYSYSASTDTQEIFNDILPIGQHTFEFSEPFHTLSVTGATIISNTANYAIIKVSIAGIVVLKGSKYIKSERLHNIRAEVVAGQQSNICVFNGATLVDNEKAPALINELWAYLSQRISLNRDVRLDDMEVGYVAEIETYLHPVMGTIESLDISMRGGKAKMRVVGNVLADTNN